MKEIDDININEINNAPKKVPAGRPQKVEISGETALFLDVFHKRAGAARGIHR